MSGSNTLARASLIALTLGTLTLAGVIICLLTFIAPWNMSLVYTATVLGIILINAAATLNMLSMLP